MRKTRKYLIPNLSKTSFFHTLGKDSFSKIVYFVLITYLFFVSVVMLVDLLKQF
jgi:hypothetical protein